jgi:hypothetical protein
VAQATLGPGRAAFRRHGLDTCRSAFPPGRGEARPGQLGGGEVRNPGSHARRPAPQHPGDNARGHAVAAAEGDSTVKDDFIAIPDADVPQAVKPIFQPVPAIYGPSGDVKWDDADPTYPLEAARRGG